MRSLDADEGAASRSPVASLGHFERDVRAEAVELLEHQVEAGIAQRLKNVFTLDPERLFVVPGCPAAIFAVQESPFGAKFRQPAARQALVLGQERKLVSGRSGVLEGKYPRQRPPESPRPDEAG